MYPALGANQSFHHREQKHEDKQTLLSHQVTKACCKHNTKKIYKKTFTKYATTKYATTKCQSCLQITALHIEHKSLGSYQCCYPQRKSLSSIILEDQFTSSCPCPQTTSPLVLKSQVIILVLKPYVFDNSNKLVVNAGNLGTINLYFSTSSG